MEQQWNVIRTSVETFMVQLGQFLPKLLGAIVILVIGWLISRVLLFVVIKGLKFLRFNVVTEKAGMDDFLKKGGAKKSAIDVLGLLVYWLAILVTLLTAFNSLGLTVVSELFARIVQFAPNVIVAVLLLTIGLYFARFVGDAIVTYSVNVGSQDAMLIGRMARYAITVFVVIIALGQIGIGNEILYPLLQILFAGMALAVGIAFGLAGQKYAGEMLDRLSGKTKK